MAIIKGTAAADLIVGTTLQDQIMGMAGNDEIHGGDGDDVIEGGTGSDNLFGGLGDDLLRGGAGNDDLDGEQGNDTLIGGTGDDRLNGGDGNDVLDGGSGADYVKASAGVDTAVGGSDLDVLDFTDMGVTTYQPGDGAVIDVSKGTATYVDGSMTFSGFETIVGSAGSDVIKGSSRAETLIGGAGENTIRSLGGADTISGSAGDRDTFQFHLKDVVDASGTHLGADVITNFDMFDTLDMRGFVPAAVREGADPWSIHDYFDITDSAAGSVLSYKTNGTSYDVAVFEGHHFDQTVLDVWRQVEGQMMLS
jgi:Ca2+-binding RTX toxin-like protein